jgi:hypothetical protein
MQPSSTTSRLQQHYSGFPSLTTVDKVVMELRSIYIVWKKQTPQQQNNTNKQQQHTKRQH